jgi:hypothetical protein
VVGVITKPDQVINISEIFGILEGRLDLTGGRIRWHVVKNQGNNERQQTLEQRDANEEQFFLESSWKEVPENQRRIKALRKTLKEMLWTHIRRELPGLVTEVQERIAFVKAGCAAAERSRATDEARREYLCEIARRFEGLVREACKGTYWNERCKALQMIDESCQVCKGFFPSFDSDDSVSQAKKLRSNVRSLSKSFAFAMEKFGKTKVIEDSFSTTGSTSDAMAQEFPAQDIIEKYYTHDNPDSVGRKPHEEWVATQIERWRAGEPQGEASEAVYTGLFRYQSKKWPNIALRHLQAIWKAIKDFIRLALDAARIDHDIREALRKDLIQPSLDTLEKESYRTLRDLLNCHERGNSGFYDGFVNIQQFMRIQAEDIAERLATLASEHIGLREQGASDKLFEHIHKDLRHLLSLPTNGSLANGIFHSIIAGKVNSIITQAFEWADDKKDEGDYAVREATHFELIPSALKNITAARVIEHVETYYEVSFPPLSPLISNLKCCKL